MLLRNIWVAFGFTTEGRDRRAMTCISGHMRGFMKIGFVAACFLLVLSWPEWRIAAADIINLPVCTAELCEAALCSDECKEVDPDEGFRKSSCNSAFPSKCLNDCSEFFCN